MGNQEAKIYQAPLGKLRTAHLAVVAEIEAEPDPEVAFRRATALREDTDVMVSEAATLRARMAFRVWRSEPMSLSQLAARLGTSKARADQLIRIAKAYKE
ncbi:MULTISPECIES: hypothetical protein [Frankia]|uniref:Uncharacterized protein n=1 Tax=Candidatus Frankia alpina TaxID=2699483 RepID=A0A4S5DJ69_9ACTN|nr:MULTISPECIES: hypothetical protein [Frankia]THJ58421.1 hypothetical protein E7Y31_18130 [Candidatus Frankia alpina]